MEYVVRLQYKEHSDKENIDVCFENKKGQINKMRGHNIGLLNVTARHVLTRWPQNNFTNSKWYKQQTWRV